MPSVNMHLNYFDHPKTRRLIGLLGRGAAELPLRLWAYCGKYHSDDGVLAGYSAQEIEDVVRWWGKPGDCVAGLADKNVRFLEPLPGGAGFRANGLEGSWREEQGHFVIYRERAKKAAEERWREKRLDDASSIPKAKLKKYQGSTGQGSAGQDKPAPAGTSSPASASAFRSGENAKELGGPAVAAPAPNRDSAPKRQSENPWQRALDHIHAAVMARKKVPPEWSGHVVKRLQVKCRRFQPEGVMALWDEACRRLWHADRVVDKDERWLAMRWSQQGHSVLFFLDELTEYICESPAWQSGRDKYLAKAAPDVAALAKSVIKKVSDITQPNDPKEAVHDDRRTDGAGGNPGAVAAATAGGPGRDPGPDRGGSGPAHESAHA